MSTDRGRRGTAHRLRGAALGAAAVIGVTACSAATGASPAQQGAGRDMAAMGGMAPNRAPAVTTTVPRTAQKGDAQVRIVNFTFSPATVTIHVGQAVEWTNRDAVAHTVDLSGVISNVLSRGDTYTQRFTAPGTYPYICSIHPFMHGRVVVTA
jgi:plastocyanin